MFDYGTFDHLTFDQAPSAVEQPQVVVEFDYHDGWNKRHASRLKREEEARRDREKLREAIERAFARVERNENLTFEQVQKSEDVIERIEVSIEDVEIPDITPLIELLDDIGKKLKSVEQTRAIDRLKRFEDEMDEDHSIEALMLVA